jgi:hypothetical protein
MTQISAGDIPALIATNPEHCLDCFRLIRQGETYHQGKDDTVPCPNCVSDLLIGEDVDTIQVTEQVAVDYGGGLIRLRRAGAAIIVAPGEVRHLIDALVEAPGWWTSTLTMEAEQVAADLKYAAADLAELYGGGELPQVLGGLLRDLVWCAEVGEYVEMDDPARLMLWPCRTCA